MLVKNMQKNHQNFSQILMKNFKKFCQVFNQKIDQKTVLKIKKQQLLLISLRYGCLMIAIKYNLYEVVGIPFFW